MRRLLLIALILLCGTGLLNAVSFGERAAAALQEKGLSPLLIVFLISMIPIVELRGAIPIGIALFGLPWPQAVLVSIAGNMLPVPFILLLLDWFLRLIGKYGWGRRFSEWLHKRTRNRSRVVESYEELGLALFVGIPLPGTGAWTGALAAKFLDLPLLKSLLWIFIGVLIAAAVVTAITLLGTTLLG
ncbi:MAG TPA: small multi-drug export protein [Candidatus Syntrophosphaera sp.]|nr:small multi-drug export protein [Candidatus Syntrophosphaera sp.]